MTTSASTTFSPSRRSTTRSTPCVLGCCGPMLITSSFVSNIAPRTLSTVKAQLSTLNSQESTVSYTFNCQGSTLKTATAQLSALSASSHIQSSNSQATMLRVES